MARIFIDANVYLDFYILGQPKFQKLLPTLLGIQNDIFVTEQIVHEVERNKLGVFLRHAVQFSAQIPKSPNLPSFERNADPAKARDWEKKISKLKADIQHCADEYASSIKRVTESIALSADPVSLDLGKIFKTAAAPTKPILGRARLRKEIGTPPPGKTV